MGIEKLNINLTVSEINIILECLMQGKFIVVNDLIHNLENQAKEQLNTKE
jgi:hypothetical protein